MPLHREVPQTLLTARLPDAISSWAFPTNPHPLPTNQFVLNYFRTLSHPPKAQLLCFQALPHSVLNEFRTLLRMRHFQPLSHQSLPHSFPKTPVYGGSRAINRRFAFPKPINSLPIRSAPASSTPVPRIGRSPVRGFSDLPRLTEHGSRATSLRGFFCFSSRKT
jgi:hypothetical protein